MSKYQLLPPLSAAEYESLKENIKTRGVLQPVVVDEAGAVVDGHHRVQVCDELGIEYPRIVVEGLTEDQKVEQALVLNLGRRHLTQEQRRDLVGKLSGDGRSVRWIANATGISKSTVQRYLSPAVVPFGTPEPMTFAEAVEITEKIQNGLAWIWDELSEWWELDPRLTQFALEFLVDDILDNPPDHAREFFVEWLHSFVAEKSA